MTAPAPLAKLSRPRLYDAVVRSRLFAALDRARQRSQVWICAPPGAGKTTLTASYLDARGLPGIWFQLDRADADPATFFYYLRMAADLSARGKRRAHAPLPLLTPEHLVDLPAFARLFFRELFARLPSTSTLVLDNFQELDDANALHHALSASFEEIPPGCTLFVLSRTEPAANYVRFAANGALQLLDWEQLKLTLEECRDVAVGQQPIGERDIVALHERSGGWAVGLRLLLERLRRGAAVDELGHMQSLQSVFDYFAQQIFDQTSVPSQVLLMQLAYLPRVTSKGAERLTGDPSASRLLEQLYRHQLFVDRRTRPEVTFQFHALFRSFLLQRAALAMTQAQRAALAQRAAKLLIEAGAHEDAVSLLLDAEQFTDASELICAIAAGMIAQGRWQTLQDWLARFPAEALNESAWLLYWRGATQSATDPVGAREVLGDAFKLATHRVDERCQLLIAALMVDSYFLEYSTFQPLDEWIPVLQRLLGEDASFASAEEELQLLHALSSATLIRRGTDPIVVRCIERMFQLLHLQISPNARSRVCFHILMYANAASLETGERVLPIVTPLLEDLAITALNRGMCNFMLSWYCCCAGQYTQGIAAVARVDRIATEEGLPFLARLGSIIGFYLEISKGDLPAAHARLEQMQRVMLPGQMYDAASHSGMRSWLALFNGEAKAALKHGAAALKIFDGVGSFMHPIMYRVPMACAAAELGEAEQAEFWLTQAEERAQSSGTMFWRPVLAAIRARIALQGADHSAHLGALQALFSEAQETRYDSMLVFLPNWMPQLCAAALVAGIETQYVSALIRQHKWKPPDPNVSQWPWSVQIYTLGEFRMLRELKPIEFGRKAPKKLLQLVKALIAFGAQGVPEQRLVDALWPELEGDAAREALAVSVKRLRELLGSSEALHYQDGRVSFDEGLCWIDVRAFERGLASEALASAALHLYRGNFLVDEPDARWAAQTRERLRSKFVRALIDQAVQLERSGDWESAGRLYASGLDADDLAESLYQGAMRCLLRQDKRAEALNLYRRMRHLLSVVLGIQPSKESHALYRSALEG